MFERILNVLAKNMGYTLLLVIALLLFAIFSDGLVAGLITAVSALLVYACIRALYAEYKKMPAKAAGAKKVNATVKKKSAK
ncbi:MAG: hypothetical protein R8N24_03065 [Alphaproteobacteria bacterium]|nr:hypothetical protein [Alphaproteobacteria bacterium]